MSVVAPRPDPVRLTIPGEFWDTQIYSGELTLFGRDGSLSRIDWNSFVKALSLPEELQLVAEAALIGSRRFYGHDVMRVIQNPEVQPVIVDQFVRLEIILRDSPVSVKQFAHQIDNPFPFPHNDADFHYGSLFVGTGSGVYVRENALGRNSKPYKVTDLPTLALASKHSVVALAAGSEGLLQLQIRRDEEYEPKPVAPNPCSTCDWSYASIVGSDHGRSLFVAAFSLVKDESKGSRTNRKLRRFSRVIAADQLFAPMDQDLDELPIEWGAKDRLYRYSRGTFAVVQNTSNGAPSFSRMGEETLDVPFNLEQFVAVRVAPFGTVLEFDDRISVLLNSGEVLEFEGEPVSWRIFPRSVNYLNHLHLIYEDHVKVVVFTSDYFTPPGERRFGTEPTASEGDQW